jgi:8-oxo-dGTP pyrophosphatase MutT (NUDIX family)
MQRRDTRRIVAERGVRSEILGPAAQATARVHAESLGVSGHPLQNPGMVNERPAIIETEGLMVVAVAAVVLRADGRVLCMRRAASRDFGAGLWETLSGRVRAGEEPLDAVRRELREEAGADLDVMLDPRPLAAYPARRGEVPMMVLVYVAWHRAGQVHRSTEHDAHEWLTPDEFARRSPFTPLVRAVEQAVALAPPAFDH